MKILRIIPVFVMPPVAAYLQVGGAKHFWINIILTLLFGVPGVIHALWRIIADNKQAASI